MEELENEVIDDKQFIVIKLGEEQYGIDISNVDNIVRLPKITRVPKSKEYYVGVMNLRGEVVPIMSLRRRFGLEKDEYTAATRIIIIRMEDQSLIGFLVDEVKEVVSLEQGQIEKPTFKLDESNATYLAGIGLKDDGLISLLDIASIVDESVDE